MARSLEDSVLAWAQDQIRVHGKKRREVAAQLEVTDQALKAALERWRDRQTRKEPADPIQAEIERQRRVSTLREERELLSDVARERSFRAQVERKLEEVVPKLGVLKPIAPQRIRTGGIQATESLVKMWSDWHAGEVVNVERMRGFNEYNFAEFQRRLETDTNATLHLAQMLQAGGWHFEELVLAALGDLVTGTAHELERHSDGNNIVEIVVDVAAEAAVRVQQYAAVFPKVRGYWISGNHGRLGDARRMQQKDPTRNWDALIGMVVQKLLANQKNVNIVVPNSYAIGFDVQGWTFLASHGHDIKMWNAIPFYGINRFVTNINALEAARNNAINYFLFAHFHRQTSLTMPAGEWFINGSLIGGNEFSLNVLGASDRPAQWMLACHRKWGVTHRWPVFSTQAIGERGPRYVYGLEDAVA